MYLSNLNCSILIWLDFPPWPLSRLLHRFLCSLPLCWCLLLPVQPLTPRPPLLSSWVLSEAWSECVMGFWSSLAKRSSRSTKDSSFFSQTPGGFCCFCRSWYLFQSSFKLTVHRAASSGVTFWSFFGSFVCLLPFGSLAWFLTVFVFSLSPKFKLMLRLWILV